MAVIVEFLQFFIYLLYTSIAVLFSRRYLCSAVYSSLPAIILNEGVVGFGGSLAVVQIARCRSVFGKVLIRNLGRSVVPNAINVAYLHVFK